MKHNIRVTVGMCVKNAGATIKEAIESIINQDFPHELMELIVVDGGSRDSTLSIINDYFDKIGMKIKIFQENKGLGEARQIVVENASGDYIIWVDGDMVLSGDFVRKQVEFMDQHPNVGIAKGKYALSHGPNLLATLEIYSRVAAKLSNYSPEKTRLKALGASGCIYRVNAIKQAGGFDRNIKGYGEDWDAECRVREAGWSLCTTEVQYRDYERLGIRWKELWLRYLKRGYDMHDIFRKYKGEIKLYKMSLPTAFLSGLFNAFFLYKLRQEKIVFFMPLMYTLKAVAWWTGYFRRSLELRRK
jgi:glycosyltransferase involved in cell wall biosynthesis